MTYLLMLILMIACFALGWQARDTKQDRIEAEEFWAKNEKPCENVDERWGPCKQTGEHFIHGTAHVFWSGSVSSNELGRMTKKSLEELDRGKYQ